MKRVDRHDDAVAGLALDAAHVNCDMQHADLADDTAFMPVDLHERQGAEKDPAQAAQNEAQSRKRVMPPSQRSRKPLYQPMGTMATGVSSRAVHMAP